MGLLILLAANERPFGAASREHPRESLVMVRRRKSTSRALSNATKLST
jgi:hypothetical protein